MTLPLYSEFKSPEGSDRPEYLRRLAEHFGLSPDARGEGGGIIVPRERVPGIIRELAAAGESRGQVMCKEYGDDEDWNGIELYDVELWAEDADEEDKATAVDEPYHTFELW